MKALSHAVLPMMLAALAACSQPDDAAPPQQAAEAPPAASEAPAAPTGRVFIVNPNDGATVTSPVTVEFGVDGYMLAWAGTYEPQTGHHHLLVDVPLPDMDKPVPADANHIHFGKGQTETSLELEPGEHTLQLLLADGNHVPHEPPLYSPVVTITVVE